ncbi:MAG: rhodanese-like domain-containing protein [Bryobacter sp.]
MEELEISPKDLQVLLLGAEPPLLLDCREPVEHGICRIEPSTLMPMNTIPENLAKLEALAEEREIVVYCHHGVRSLNTAAWLRRQGVERVRSLRGGIERWSVEIDPQVPRY